MYYTIEINGEILTDFYGNNLHFNSYEEALEYIEEENLKDAEITKQR